MVSTDDARIGSSSFRASSSSGLRSDLGVSNYGSKRYMIGSEFVSGGRGVNNLSFTMDDLVQARRHNSRVAKKVDSIVSSGKLVVFGGGKRLRMKPDDISNLSCTLGDAGLPLVQAKMSNSNGARKKSSIASIGKLAVFGGDKQLYM